MTFDIASVPRSAFLRCLHLIARLIGCCCVPVLLSHFLFGLEINAAELSMNLFEENMLRFVAFVAALMMAVGKIHGLSSSSSSFAPSFSLGRPSTAFRRQESGGGSRAIMTMRDRSSSYWFSVGDSVRVIDDVEKAGTNLLGREGKVVQTWEKCDVDPTCCCAEQVDLGMAVHVEFQAADGESEESFVHYFAETELLKVQEKEETPPPQNVKSSNLSETVAFDGMSCKAFKLDQLKMGEQAKRIAAFEASRTKQE